MNLKEKLVKLEHTIELHTGLQDFYGGVSQKAIQDAESALGILFPFTYCWFLMTYGVGSFGDTELFGIFKNADGKRHQIDSVPDVVWVTGALQAKYNMPENSFLICGDGMGRYYGVIASKDDRKMDGEVFVLDVDNGGHCEFAGCSLSVFLELAVKEAIEGM